MSVEHEAHLERILTKVAAKYRKGQVEHGGRLWLKDNVKSVFEELVDLAIYGLTVLEQMETGNFPPKNPLSDKDETCVKCGGIHFDGQECKGCED